MDTTTEVTETINDVCTANNVMLLETETKYWQLASFDLEAYEASKVHFFLMGLNVGEAKYQPITGWYFFRVYPDGKEVDDKQDLKY